MYPAIYFTDEIFLSTYFLLISTAYMVSTFWLVQRAKKKNYDPKTVIDLCLIIMLCGLAGSRIMHILWEHPEYYYKNPWAVIKIWQGGFVFYGGAIGAVVGSYIYLKLKNQKLSQWLNLFAPVIAFTYGTGRLATFLSGSGYGIPTDLPWAVIYPPGTEAPSGVRLHPTQIYAGLWELSLMFLLLQLEKREYFKQNTRLFFFFLCFHGLGRAIWEQFRDDFRGNAVLGLSISTWISLGILSFGITQLILKHSFSKNRS